MDRPQTTEITMTTTEAIKFAREMIDRNSKVAILTGAGVSTDSGLPDYRGPNGIWTKDPELELMSNLDNFMNDPEIRKRSWLRKVVGVTGNYQPNLSHYILANFQNNSGKVNRLVTQNVDGLHLDAGSDPGTTIEIHGNYTKARCTGCRIPVPFPTDLSEDSYEDPTCPSCFSLIKPDVIMFGELLNANDLNVALAAAHDAGVLLAIGTSLSVYPIAGMADMCYDNGGVIISISNQKPDWVPTTHLDGEIGDILPELLGDYLP